MEPHIYTDRYTVQRFLRSNKPVKRIFEDIRIDKDKLWAKYSSEVEETIKNHSMVHRPDVGDYVLI